VTVGPSRTVFLGFFETEKIMPITSTDSRFHSLLATEMKSAIERSVECWMAEVDHALSDTRLTTLGRLHAVQSIVEQYKILTGKTDLSDCVPHDS
jgi:hypothetical protein